VVRDLSDSNCELIDFNKGGQGQDNGEPRYTMTVSHGRDVCDNDIKSHVTVIQDSAW
jgi:hypothetical protein